MWVFSIFVFITVSHAFPKPESNFAFPSQWSRNPLTPGTRIIGGQDAVPHAYPYQVAIYVTSASSKDFCGGSLISQNYVLTAAHCVDEAVKVDLIFGAHNVSATEDTQVRVTSSQFIVHPNWVKATKKNDIALIKLSTPIKETANIKTIKIASGTSTFAGSQGIATGWGKTSNAQKKESSILKYITSPILSNDDCKKASNDYKKIVVPTILCLSGQGKVGTCHGDSGGPLIVDGVQIGLVSFGYKDCTAGFPSVFTRLTEYKDWITKNSDVKF
ncbi:hypothetical protein JTB14_034692 [Gonioctena quinquepunctata]|nr:hypothetical protein JTB14_034692 [Gonioctena quinquepunctata]